MSFFFFFSFLELGGEMDGIVEVVLLTLRLFFRFFANFIAKMHFCIENCLMYILYLLPTMFIEIFLKL